MKQNYETGRILSLSSSCLTRGSTKQQCRMDTGIKCQYDRRIEYGRSMVEMLGTLAIIGVLSVGGIMGYSYGMDLYRANTIMNDIMLRAVDSISQFNVTGDVNLSEWPTITAGKYTIGLENDTIGIQVSGLPKRLCEMVFDGMINNATVKIGTTEYDTATDDVCGDTNTMVFYVDDAAGSTTEETTTTTTEPPCKSDNCPCTSNDECNTDQYCAPTAPTCTEAFPDGAPGICKKLDFNEHTIIVDGVSEKWWISNSKISHNEAIYACARYGGMISGYDIIENWNGYTAFFSANKRGQLLYEAIGAGDAILMVNEKEGCGGFFLNVAASYVTGGAYSDRSYRAICYK